MFYYHYPHSGFHVSNNMDFRVFLKPPCMHYCLFYGDEVGGY